MLRNKWYTENWYGMGAGISFKVTKKLREVQSPLQKIEIFETESFGKLMVIDDCVMLTDRCNHFYHEMLAHPVLTVRTEPTHVAIIGGGDCGVLREVLKHDHVVSVDQIEIDSVVTEVCEEFFPHLSESNNDPRVRLRFTDGIEWMRTNAAEQYEVIIIDSTDPVGMAAGLFSKAFHQDCFRVLCHGGSLILQTGSPIFHAEHIRGMRDSLRGAGFSDVATITFPQPDYPSGTWSATLAVKGASARTLIPGRSTRLPKAKYYSRDVHEAALSTPSFAF